MDNERPSEKAMRLSELYSVCLNNQTTGNLIKYLQGFPDDAKITIWHNYKTYDCQICCNFEHQQKQNTVQVMTGSFIAEG